MTNKRILLLSKYARQGASSRLRTLQYGPYFESSGYHIEIHSLFSSSYLDSLYSTGDRSKLAVLKLYFDRLKVLMTARNYDVVWVEKEVFPYLPAAAERLFNFFDIPFVVDYDDAIFHNYDQSRNPVVRTVLGRKIDVVMRMASHVVVGNTYLGDRAHAAGAQAVTVIPTVVDAARYDPELKRHGQRPVIGWIGSPSTQKFLVDVAPALSAACKKHGAMLLVVGASDALAEVFDGTDLEIAPWSEDSEAYYIAQMNVGVMPLNDGPWEKGKCGYKLIQYMAMAVPVIASPVGANIDIVERGRCGFLAESLQQWTVALDTILTDVSAQVRLGESGRAVVLSHYSVDAQVPSLIAVFDAVTGE